MCFLVKRKRGFNSRNWAERECGGGKRGGKKTLKKVYIVK